MMSLDIFPYKTSWSTVNRNFHLRGQEFLSELSNSGCLSGQNATFLLPLGRANIYQQKNYYKIETKKIALEKVSDQTQSRSKSSLIRLMCD